MTFISDAINTVKELCDKAKSAKNQIEIVDLDGNEYMLVDSDGDRELRQRLVTSSGRALNSIRDIGKWLMTKPRLLIMDEPTRGIDVGANYEVYNIMDRLAAEKSGILFISSEIEELIGIADRIIVMSQGEIVKIFDKKDFDVTALMAAAFREAVA